MGNNASDLKSWEEFEFPEEDEVTIDEILRVFDLLNDQERLANYLADLRRSDFDKLYSHQLTSRVEEILP